MARQKRPKRQEVIPELVEAAELEDRDELIAYVNEGLAEIGLLPMSENEVRRHIQAAGPEELSDILGAEEKRPRGRPPAKKLVPEDVGDDDGPPGYQLFSVDAKREAKKTNGRYAMDEYAAKNIKQAGRKATMRLHALLTNDAQWEKLSPKDQMRAIDMALVRAYGRAETESVDAKLSQGDDEVVGLLPASLKKVAEQIVLPELQKHKAAEELKDD